MWGLLFNDLAYFFYATNSRALRGRMIFKDNNLSCRAMQATNAQMGTKALV